MTKKTISRPVHKTPIDEQVLPDLFTAFAYSLLVLSNVVPASPNCTFAFVDNFPASSIDVHILTDESPTF